MLYIIAIGLFQAMFAVGILQVSRIKDDGDALLTFLAFGLFLHLGIKLVIFNFVSDFHLQYQINTFIAYCYAPLLYLYTLKVKDNNFRPIQKWYLFIPLLIGAVLYFTVLKIILFSKKPDYNILAAYNSVSFWAMIFSHIIFTFRALYQAKKYLKLKKRESDLIICIASLFISIIFFSFVFYFMSSYGYVWNIISRTIVYIIFVIVGLAIVHYKYMQANDAAINVIKLSGTRIHVNQIQEHFNPNLNVVKIPEKRNILTTKHQETIWKKIEDYIADTPVFTDSELNLDKLAHLTGINKYHISETLNSFGNKSFYRYINEYRIRYIIQKMEVCYKQNTNINILYLAHNAGFKSKSSFNRYFKEITGHIPKNYIKNVVSRAVFSV